MHFQFACAYLLSRGIQPVIPSKANEDRTARPVAFDRGKYRELNIMERLIGRLKECRRILTRFEKRAAAFWRKQAEVAEDEAGTLQTRAAAATVHRAPARAAAAC